MNRVEVGGFALGGEVAADVDRVGVGGLALGSEVASGVNRAEVRGVATGVAPNNSDSVNPLALQSPQPISATQKTPVIPTIPTTPTAPATSATPASPSARLGLLRPGPRARKWLESAGIRRVWVYQIPLRLRFRGIDSRDGLILEGPPASPATLDTNSPTCTPLLGEAAPFWNYDTRVAARWFPGAIALATRGFPSSNTLGDDPATSNAPRGNLAVPLNVTVPVVSPEQARRLVAESGCRTAKIKVVDPRSDLESDLQRLRAVRAALGPRGAIRIDLNAAWSLDEAHELLPRYAEAAQGLEYAEQPCAQLSDLARLQELTGIPVAADESIRLGAQPLQALRDASRARLAAVVVKAMPLGGPGRILALLRRLREIDPTLELPKIVVSSALDTGVGLTAGAYLAHAIAALAPIPQPSNLDPTQPGPYQTPQPHQHQQTPTLPACGLGTGRLFAGGILEAEPRLSDGQLVPPTRLVLRRDLPPADPGLCARWQARLEEIASLNT